MSIPVMVEQTNGTYAASVLGSPAVRATGATKEAAVTALRGDLDSRVSAGEIVFVEIESRGVLALAETEFKDDPQWHAMWDEIVTEAYRYRDEQKAQEFPE